MGDKICSLELENKPGGANTNANAKCFSHYSYINGQFIMNCAVGKRGPTTSSRCIGSQPGIRS
jgi:hypothetical protein